MPNYFQRDSDGTWYITLETGTRVKCSYYGSLEVAYRMGLKENIHQQLAEMLIDESTKKHLESKMMNDAVEGRHNELPKHAASDALVNRPYEEIKDLL